MEEIKLPFEGQAFSTAWNEWIQYRKEKKIPKYVPTGLKKTFTNLIKISGNNESVAIEIINQSMEQNYQGLFPIKNMKYDANKAKIGNIGKTIEFDKL